MEKKTGSLWCSHRQPLLRPSVEGTLRDVMIGNLPVRLAQGSYGYHSYFCYGHRHMFYGQWLKKDHHFYFIWCFGARALYHHRYWKAMQLHFSVGVCVLRWAPSRPALVIIRDVLLNNVPLVFRKRNLCTGKYHRRALLFLLTHSLDNDVAKIICILLIFTIRLLAVKV